MRKIEGMRLKRYNLSLDEILVEAAKEVAWQQRTTLSEAVRSLLKRYVDEHRAR